MTIDTVNATRISETSAGIQLQRRAVIEYSGDAVGAAYRALQSGELPRLGTTHPVIPGVQCTERTVEISRNGIAEATMVYKIPDAEDVSDAGDETAGTLSVDVVTVIEETINDFRGNLMIVGYSGLAFGVGGARVTVESAGRVEVERPLLRASRRKRLTSARIDDALLFTGKVNALPWSGRAAKTWLCTGIRIDQTDAAFDHLFQFVYNPKTWQVQISHAEQGTTPIDAELGNGIAAFDVYEPLDFAPLGVSVAG